MGQDRRQPDADTIPDDGRADLSEKQARILAYLRRRVEEQTYFKSRRIGRELDMTPKEVGRNMHHLVTGDYDVQVSKWGYSNSTTWMVTG